MSVHFPWDGPSLIRCPLLNQKRTSSECLQVRHQERRPHRRERSTMAASGSSATWLGGVGRVKDTGRLFTKAEQIETRRVRWAPLLPGRTASNPGEWIPLEGQYTFYSPKIYKILHIVRFCVFSRWRWNVLNWYNVCFVSPFQNARMCFFIGKIFPDNLAL